MSDGQKPKLNNVEALNKMLIPEDVAESQK